jgi:hypothetical protein
MTATVASCPPLPCHVTTMDSTVIASSAEGGAITFAARNGERYATVPDAGGLKTGNMIE